MVRYSFQHHVPPDYERSYPVPLYQEARHRALTAATWTSFFLVRADLKKIFAEVHFLISGDQALSRPAAPFGAISFDGTLPLAELQRFIQAMERALQDLACRTITLVHPPTPYQQHADVMLALLQDAGYRQTATELAALIPVTEAPFDSRLHAWESRKLRQAKQAAMRCGRIPNDQGAQVYRFLQRCREERSQKLSMTEEQILELIRCCPDAIRLYTAEQENSLAAAVLAVHDHPDILYTFYYGHAAALDEISPVVRLMEHVYADCAASGISLLNLGTSTVNGATYLPLLQFKLHLGAIPARKVTVTKTIGT